MVQQEETQQDTLIKIDSEGTPIGLNDIVIFAQSGLLGRGKVIATTLAGTHGCVVVQSLREKSRTLLATAMNCVVVSKGSV